MVISSIRADGKRARWRNPDHGERSRRAASATETLDREALAIHVVLGRSRYCLHTRWAAEPMNLVRELCEVGHTVVTSAAMGRNAAAVGPSAGSGVLERGRWGTPADRRLIRVKRLDLAQDRGSDVHVRMENVVDRQRPRKR